MQCEVHQVDMKLVPAGTSRRTGKPYNAFYACTVAGCNWKPGQNPSYPQNFDPSHTINPVKPAPQTANYTSTPPPQIESREDYGRRLAIHGFVNGLLAAGASPDAIKYQLKNLIQLEDAINEALEGKFYDPVNVDEIPF